MSKIAIVTDSTATLSPAEVEAFGNVFVVPITFMINNNVYPEGIGMSNDEFYAKLPTLDKLPTTAPPTPQIMLSLYDDLVKKGYDQIISIHLTAGITGFVNNLRMFTRNYQDAEIVVYDSHMALSPMGYQVKIAAAMANEGVPLDHIINTLNQLRDSMGVYFVVDDLKNLVTGGRLSKTGAFAGGLLKIKPILTLSEDTHEIIPIGKIRTMKKALVDIEERFKTVYEQRTHPLHVMLMGTNNEPAVKKWEADFKSRFPDVSTEVDQIGPVIGTHVGNNAYGLAWINEM